MLRRRFRADISWTASAQNASSCSLWRLLRSAIWEWLLPKRTGSCYFSKFLPALGTGVCFVGGARYIHAAAAGRRLNVAQGLFGGSIQLGAGFVILAVPQAQPDRGMESNFSGIRGHGADRGVGLVFRGAGCDLWPSPPGRLHEMLLAPQLWLLGILQMATFSLSVIVGSWVVVFLDKRS